MTLARKHEALRNHQRLTEGQWALLSAAGIAEGIVHARLVGWDGAHFTVPVVDRSRHFVALAEASICARTGELIPGERARNRVRLFGELQLGWGPLRVYLVEGVGEALVLQSQGFYALAATGNGLSPSAELLQHFHGVPEVFVCLRRSPESVRAALAVREMLPRARIVSLPKEVGPGGGLFDFFVRLGRTEVDFRALVELAARAEKDA